MPLTISLESDPVRFEVVFPQEDGSERSILVDLERDLQIKVDRINEQLCDQPAKEAMWSALAETAAARIKELKNQKETVYAQVALRVRGELESRGTKPTDKTVESYAKTDEAYLAVVALLEQMEYHASLLEAVHQGFKSQSRMLEVLSNNLRAQGDPVLARIPLVQAGAEGPTTAKIPDFNRQP